MGTASRMLPVRGSTVTTDHMAVDVTVEDSGNKPGLSASRRPPRSRWKPDRVYSELSCDDI